MDVPKSVEMASYLVPYKGYAFTEDFTSDLQVLPEKKGKRSSQLPLAPSMIYLSPCTSEASLKMFDFLLQGGTHDLEEQDKAKMYEIIVTKDMKYKPEPKPAAPAMLEMPLFGVSPSPSFIEESLETTTQQEEQTTDNLTALSIEEPLNSTQQEQTCEETSPKEPEIIPKQSYCLHKKIKSDPNICTYSYIFEGKLEKYPGKDKPHRRETYPKEKMIFEEKVTYSSLTEIQKRKQELKKHKPRKLGKRGKVGLKKKRLPKHRKPFSATTGSGRSRDITCSIRPRSAHSATYVGQKVFPALGRQALSPTEKRPFSRNKTEQQYNEGYKFSKEKDIRVVFLRKENERIQQVEEQSLTQEFEKKLSSHRHCFTPNNSQQYQSLEYSKIVSDSFFALMKPFKQYQRRPYTVMEESTINLPRDFPYRLAWGTPTTQDLNIKLYHPKLKFRKEQGTSKVIQERTLQPTRSIPDKGRYILVNDPNSSPSAPVMSSLESRLLSARFPAQRERVLRSLF
ncbi:uncharacterized protein LOC120302725 [Crotalus tigris]|uniref:uncharacterized protein LOC120302725 n=1 Tax=Crotalus tigris TaxID=88082 RepID=UPI00192F7FAD|nr:uncharacterized protein LOC120302725 [Crotalus tigris]